MTVSGHFVLLLLSVNVTFLDTVNTLSGVKTMYLITLLPIWLEGMYPKWVD